MKTGAGGGLEREVGVSSDVEIGGGGGRGSERKSPDKCTKVLWAGKFRGEERGSGATLFLLEARKSPREGRRRIVTPRVQLCRASHQCQLASKSRCADVEVGVRSCGQGSCLGIEGEAAPRTNQTQHNPKPKFHRTGRAVQVQVHSPARGAASQVVFRPRTAFQRW